MKKFVLLMLFSAIFFLGACGEPESSTATQPETTAPTEELPIEQPTSTPIPETIPDLVFEIEEVKFEGSGDSVSPEFTLPEGVTMIGLAHNGTSNFIVELLSETGETVGLLVNTIDRYTGIRAIGVQEDAIIGIRPGTYVLGITADGDWKIILGILRNVSAYEFLPEERLPVNFGGKGDAATGIFPVEDSGILSFTFTHDGESNFIVTLLNAEDGSATILVNEIGAYQGTKAVGFRKGGFF